MRRTPRPLFIALVLCPPLIGSPQQGDHLGLPATLRGRVTFSGTPPPPQKILIAKDTQVCGEGYREIEEVSVSQDGGLRNTVVYIEGVPENTPWNDPPGGYLLDQRGCRFRPFLLVIPKGKDLAILNSDPVLHNIHTYEVIGRARRSLFNVGQPEQGSRLTKTIRPRRSQVVKIECDAHEFMHAWMFVAENPFYRVTDEDGAFSVEGIPPGTYTLKAWHPRLGTREAEIVVAAGQTVEAAFEFQGE